MIKEIERLYNRLEALRLEGNTVGVEAARVISQGLGKSRGAEGEVRRAGPSPGWGQASAHTPPPGRCCVQSLLGPGVVTSGHSAGLGLARVMCLLSPVVTDPEKVSGG